MRVDGGQLARAAFGLMAAAFALLFVAQALLVANGVLAWRAPHPDPGYRWIGAMHHATPIRDAAYALSGPSGVLLLAGALLVLGLAWFKRVHGFERVLLLEAGALVAGGVALGAALDFAAAWAGFTGDLGDRFLRVAASYLPVLAAAVALVLVAWPHRPSRVPAVAGASLFFLHRPLLVVAAGDIAPRLADLALQLAPFVLASLGAGGLAVAFALRAIPPRARRGQPPGPPAPVSDPTSPGP